MCRPPTRGSKAGNEVLIAQYRVERDRTPRGAFTWHMRPLMELVMCESSAGQAERIEFPYRG